MELGRFEQGKDKVFQCEHVRANSGTIPIAGFFPPQLYDYYA